MVASDQVCKVIAKHLDWLCQNSRNPEIVFTKLIGNGVIKQFDKDTLMSHAVEYSRFSNFYKLIQQKSILPDIYSFLISVLNDSGNEHVARKLTEELPIIADEDDSTECEEELEIKTSDEPPEPDILKIDTIKAQIKENLPTLSGETTNLETLLIHLKTAGLIGEDESDTLKNKPSSFIAFRELYRLVCTRLDDSNYLDLKSALQITGNNLMVRIIEE